jgi:hypothetical protein
MLPSLMYTVNAIRTFHVLVASQLNLRSLSAFLDIHQLRQQRLRGVELFQRFRTNHMVICAVWGFYYFLRGNLTLLFIMAQIILFLSTASRKIPDTLLVSLYLCHLIAPEGIVPVGTIISCILGHSIVMANTTHRLRLVDLVWGWCEDIYLWL